MPVSEDLKADSGTLDDASRPYRTADERARSLRGRVGLGRSQSDSDLPPEESTSPEPNGDPPLRPGMEDVGYPEDGGLQREPPFQTSDVLMRSALRSFPPAVQESFKNRKIDRPADTSDAYDEKSAAYWKALRGQMDLGGYYDPESGAIALGRGIESVSGQADAVNGARHEILHAIQSEGLPFSQDRAEGYPAFRAALAAELPALLGDPRSAERGAEAQQKITSDPDHAWTAVADLYLRGQIDTPQLSAYFDQMQRYQPSQDGGGEADESGPPERPESLRGGLRRPPESATLSAAGRLGRSFEALVRERQRSAKSVDKLGNYLGALGGFVGENLKTVGRFVSEDPQEIRAKGERPVTVGEAGGALLNVLGSPYLAVSGEIVTHHVENDPFMGPAYKRTLGTYLPDDSENPLVRWQVAHEVMDSHISSLLRAGDDPALTQQERDAANVAAFGLIMERAAELGGPQAARGALRYASPAAKAAAAQFGKTATAAIERAPAAARGFAQSEMGMARVDLGLSGDGGDALRGLSDTQLRAFLSIEGLSEGDRAAAEGERLRRASAAAAPPAANVGRYMGQGKNVVDSQTGRIVRRGLGGQRDAQLAADELNAKAARPAPEGVNVPRDAEQLAAEAGQTTEAQAQTNARLREEIAARQARPGEPSDSGPSAEQLAREERSRSRSEAEDFLRRVSQSESSLNDLSRGGQLPAKNSFDLPGQTELDAVEAIGRGEKPATFYRADTTVKDADLFARTQGLPYKMFAITPEGEGYVVIGKDQASVERLSEILMRQAKSSKVGNDPMYHIELGKALGYDDADIAAYLRNNYSLASLQRRVASDLVPGTSAAQVPPMRARAKGAKALQMPPGMEAELAANPPERMLEMAKEKIDAFVGKTAWPDELKNLVARSMMDRAGDIQERRRGLQPIAVTMAKARAKGIDVRELAEMPPGVAGNAEQMASVFDTLYGPKGDGGVFAELKNLRSALATVEQPSDEQQLRLLIKEFEVNTLSKTLMGLRAESGRGQRMLRELYKIQRESAAGKMRDTYSRAIAAVGGKKNAEILLRSLNRIATEPGLSAAERDIKYVQVLQGADRAPVGRKLEEAVIANLISNPITHVGYVAAQGSQVYAESAAFFVSAAVDTPRALVTHTERQRTFSGALASLVGTHMAMKDATRYMLQYLATEVRPRDIASLAGAETGVVAGHALEGWPGKVIRLPLRGVEGYTVWFHEVGRQQRLWRDAGDAVALSGESPFSRSFWSKTADLVKNPTPKMDAAAEHAGQQQSLRQQASGRLAEGIKTIRDIGMDTLPGQIRPLFFLEPFVNISFAVSERGLEFSPLGFLRTVPKVGVRGGEASDAFGRAAVGTAVMAYFWQQAIAGNVTGEVPSDPKKKEQFYAAGKKRMSIRTPDGVWHDYSRWDPIAKPVKAISGIQEALASGDGQPFSVQLMATVSGRVAMAIGRSLADSNFTFGVKNLIDTFERPSSDEAAFDRIGMFAANVATEFVPFVGLQRGAVSVTDPYVRSPQDPMDEFKAVIPGLSQEVQAATDRWGQPRLREPHEIHDLVNETIDSLPLGDIITVDGEEIAKVGISVGLTAKDIAGLKLSKEEALAYRIAAATGVHNLLNDLFTDQRQVVGEDGRPHRWSEMDERARKSAVSRTISEGRRVARSVVADTILLNPTSEEQTIRGTVMRLATISHVSDRADFLRGLDARGLLTDRVRHYLDAHRRQGERTVVEYLRTR